MYRYRNREKQCIKMNSKSASESIEDQEFRISKGINFN